MEKRMFASGCALMFYKPGLAEKQTILLFLILIIPVLTFSQKVGLGGEISYGRSYGLKDFFYPVTQQSVDDYKIGVVTSVLSRDSAFSLNTGILFNRKGILNKSVNYIKIPVGVDHLVGNKVQGLIGAGLYVGYLTSVIGIYPPEILTYPTDFQLGGFIEAGMNFKLSPVWALYWKGQAEMDFTTLYKEVTIDHSGQKTISLKRSYGYSVQVGIKYRFRKK